MTQIRFQEKLTCDVLVVGAGAAGIRAALTAAAAGRDTVLLSETPPGESGSTFYPLSPPWGVMYAEDPQDAQTFYEEILTSSGGCIDRRLAQTLAEESVRVRDTLLAEGLPLRTHASMGLTGCVGTKPRGAVLETLTTAQAVWRQRLAAAKGLKRAVGWQAVTLLTHGGRAAGVAAVNREGQLLMACAKAVVLATGGPIGLYERSYAYGGLTGAGMAMAARRGAQTVNLEFMQFINGTLSPVYGLNYYQFALVEEPRVRNSQGEAFLRRYLPEGITEQQCLKLRGMHGPFSVEDAGRYFDLAIAQEAGAGGDTGATILPDAARLQGARYAHWRAFLAQEGFQTDTPMTIAPFAQACNGGIRMLPGAHTDVPGLLVCGECAGGCHGANRMGGNAILATQVFGRLAGEAASAECADVAALPELTAEDALCQFRAEMAEPHPNATPAEALQTVRGMMQTYAYLMRNEAGLLTAEKNLAQLRVDALALQGSADAAQAAQAKNAVDAARLMICAMRKRKESRGSHYRTDYPDHDPALANPIQTGWSECSGSE